MVPFLDNMQWHINVKYFTTQTFVHLAEVDRNAWKWHAISIRGKDYDAIGNHLDSFSYRHSPIIKSTGLPDGELNPGLPRDRRGYSPLYYRGLLACCQSARWFKVHFMKYKMPSASDNTTTWQQHHNMGTLLVSWPQFCQQRWKRRFKNRMTVALVHIITWFRTRNSSNTSINIHISMHIGV